MLRYPISTLLYLAKISIKDKIQDILKLHNNIDIKVEVKVIDKNNKIIKYHKQRSHSFVANFLGVLANYFVDTPFNTVSVFKATNTSGTQFSTVYPLYGNDGANDSTYGIVVGTGTATPTPTDTNLESQIVNGTGTGQLVYSAHTFNPSSGSVITSNNTAYFTITRQFTNQSGSPITVSEVGFIAVTKDTSSNTDYVLIIHDLLSSPVTVPNLSILQITYTISVTT